MKNIPLKKMIFGAVFAATVVTVAFIYLFVWYTKTAIPRIYATDYTNLWWGFVHGLFIIPTFIISLFSKTITIYQAPNVGNWYNLGYFIGISMILGGSHGARTKAPRRKKRTIIDA